MSPSRRLWLVSVVVGAGLGAFSLLADGIIGGRLFGILGNIASPWGLAAFFVGRLTTSPKRGAAAGALTLVVGIAVYYLGGALRGYDVGEANQMPVAMPRIVRPKMTRASSRKRGELTAAAGSSVELDMAAWCHVLGRD